MIAWQKNIAMANTSCRPSLSQEASSFLILECAIILLVSKSHTHWIILSAATLSLLFGFFNELNALFLWSILSVVIGGYLITLLNTKHSVLVVLLFISFQGFFKVISNYHPIVHLGADLIMIVLVFKTILQIFFSKTEEKFTQPPLTVLFAIHFGWVAICFFNPYSIGFVPSLAGSKIYITMLLLYFFGFYVTRSLKDVHLFFRFFVVLASVHALAGFVQGFLGASSVLWIHPRYSVQLAKYAGQAFRPFGLTHVPGAPSVFIYTALPFFVYFILLSKSYLEKIILLIFMPIIGQTLLFCQVRSSIIKGLVAMLIFVGLFFTSRIRMGVEKKLYAFTLTGVAVLVILITMPIVMEMSIDSLNTNEAAIERSLSAFEYDKMSMARRDTWGRFINYVQVIPFGAGFSRVGASAGAFRVANAADPFFKDMPLFADNMFITFIIELGIPGLLAMTLLILLILSRGLTYWRQENRQPLIGAQIAITSSLVAIFIGSYGSEGIVYNPESAFFWFFAGVLMKLGTPDFNTDSDMFPHIAS